MLKLPAIMWGCVMILWGAALFSVWLLVPGLVVLGLGLFFFGWDFGAAGPHISTGAEDAEPSDEADGSGGTDLSD